MKARSLAARPLARTPRPEAAPVALGFAALVALLASGCGGKSKGADDATSKNAGEVRSIAVVHEPCADAGQRVTSYDANGDHKPDVQRVLDANGREVCRTTDLNHDGKPELFEYYGPGGETRRREASYTHGGEITSIEYFEGGKRVRRELDTTGQQRVDTWDYFDPASGTRTKRERDLNGDGRIDQWWAWQGDQLTIAVDKTGDGRPDPEATIVVGGAQPSGAAPGAPAPGAPAPGAPASGSLAPGASTPPSSAAPASPAPASSASSSPSPSSPSK